jgi:hypothetical protein
MKQPTHPEAQCEYCEAIDVHGRPIHLYVDLDPEAD